jgi:hypothetical protein
MNTPQTDARDDKAKKAASALRRRDTALSALKSDMNAMPWMIGFVLALQVAIFLRMLAH